MSNQEGRVLPGINVQWPWSEMLLDKSKIIETRKYPLPNKYKNVELALIETPGPGRRQLGIKARIVGTITFSDCFKYEDRKHWVSDFPKHRVPRDHDLFGWSDKIEKWGWIVSAVKRAKIETAPPANKGLVFTRDCEVI